MPSSRPKCPSLCKRRDYIGPPLPRFLRPDDLNKYMTKRLLFSVKQIHDGAILQNSKFEFKIEIKNLNPEFVFKIFNSSLSCVIKTYGLNRNMV